MREQDGSGRGRLRAAEAAAMLAWRLSDDGSGFNDGIPQTARNLELIAHAAVAIAAAEAEAEWTEPADFAIDDVADLLRVLLEGPGDVTFRRDLADFRALVRQTVAPYLAGGAS